MYVLVTGGCGFIGSHVAQIVYDRFTACERKHTANTISGAREASQEVRQSILPLNWPVEYIRFSIAWPHQFLRDLNSRSLGEWGGSKSVF